MTLIRAMRNARVQNGWSLRKAAAKSGLAAPNLSAIETGRRGATVGTLERVAESLGLVFVPVQSGGRATVADAVESIRGQDDSTAYRVLIQVADDLSAVEPFVRALLAAERPAAVSPRWDAAVAGIVEWRLAAVGLPSPAWVVETAGDVGWRWVPSSGPLPVRTDRVPAPLLRRGVLLEADELVSV
ncbi:helix-turn-helix domain-containing protein [Rathayibacter sp. VKM Ac-2754]|uniref:helix-turn-helix domain-containing protein n=1 Tax=Rathayibacter sp. VKM Ac-2754 TaxID=2609251 RepID=UPI00135BEEE8|nr:helix-turn-helix transcriptional regulator [Rathayibacter sp. VKM Ac-2754]MWV58949.1 helix-turn-helix domain-containing protein [Rathayibacter sp. VKM Ac-2754]